MYLNNFEFNSIENNINFHQFMSENKLFDDPY